MLLYYISDRTQFPGDEPARRRHLLSKISEAARCGVDFIQLREKDLATRDLEALACEAISRLENETKFFINSRTDVAIAVGADGVHLRSNDISPETVRSIWPSGVGAHVAVSCHSAEEVAAAQGADFVVFGPVFEKGNNQPAGLAALHRACQYKIPVLALGGVTLANVRSCVEAGAAGIAGIRLFQENDLAAVVPKLRALALS